MSEDIATVILCGGRGTRAYPLTEEFPKPLLTVGEVPLVEHVIGIYGRRGYTRFVLALGYLGDRIVDELGRRELPWSIDFVDTGVDTLSGERLRRCTSYVGDTFFATYADGFADIDLDALLAMHRGHGDAATVTTVPLPSPYGTLDIDGDHRVRAFREKPRLAEHWINAGLFVLRGELFDRHRGADLERNVLPSLASADELRAFRHVGFWRSCDTYKDVQELEAIVNGEGPSLVVRLSAPSDTLA